MATQYYAATADAVGTVAATFNISGTNDQLSVAIDGGSNQVFTLTHGAARTAAQIVTDLAGLTGATAFVFGDFVRITTSSALAGSSTILFNTPSNNANSTLGFTGTVSGSARQNSTFTGASKQNIIDGIETVLLAAGWTTVSGHGTTTLLMQSGLTPSPQNLQMRLRIKDNAGNCACLTIENVSGTKAETTGSSTAGSFLLPGAAKTFRVIANKYQAFVFTSATATAREFCCFGVPMLPPNLQGVVTEAIWNSANCFSDSSATAPNSLRTSLNTRDGPQGTGSAQQPNQCLICNGNLWDIANTGGGSSGQIQLIGMGTSDIAFAGIGYRWHDDAALLYDPVICWGLTAGTDEAKGRGILWDAAVSTDSYPADSTTTFDSHNWWVITNSNGGSNAVYQRGSLILVVP